MVTLDGKCFYKKKRLKKHVEEKLANMASSFSFSFYKVEAPLNMPLVKIIETMLVDIGYVLYKSLIIKNVSCIDYKYFLI